MLEQDRNNRVMKTKEKKDWRIEGKNSVEDFLWRFNLEGARLGNMLLESVENGDKILESICRVFWKNSDKGDFYENLRTYMQIIGRSDDPKICEIEDVMKRGGVKAEIIAKAVDIF